MSARRRQFSGAAGGLWLAALVLAPACFDTQLIPADDDERAGAASVSGRSGAAGESMAEGGGGASGGSLVTGGASGGAPATGGVAPSGGGGGGSGGEAGSGTAPHVTWLELVESSAPSSEPVNAELNIAGAFYAYADACASLSWDPVTRCASGQLCAAAGNFDNWGMAIGFDFRNTGATGSPPDTKLLWNPDETSALGVAWQISGSAPGLQVWVLNMAPSWQGECSAMTCEIAGPPDGVAAAQLNGQLLFDDMQKDVWGGSGIRYTFDPAAVHALQLKLPAINVGAASFDFCIEALGVIR